LAPMLPVFVSFTVTLGVAALLFVQVIYGNLLYTSSILIGAAWLGVVPLVISTGAGSEMRHAMGVAVFSGMIGVTAFGIFFTPMFYVLLRALAGNRPLTQHGEASVGKIAHTPAE